MNTNVRVLRILRLVVFTPNGLQYLYSKEASTHMHALINKDVHNWKNSFDSFISEPLLVWLSICLLT